jgi:hypothetical protein
MAPAGRQAETSLTDALERGGHILVIEGSVLLADGGCTAPSPGGPRSSTWWRRPRTPPPSSTSGPARR